MCSACIHRAGIVVLYDRRTQWYTSRQRRVDRNNKQMKKKKSEFASETLRPRSFTLYIHGHRYMFKQDTFPDVLAQGFRRGYINSFVRTMVVQPPSRLSLVQRLRTAFYFSVLHIIYLYILLVYNAVAYIRIYCIYIHIYARNIH